MDLSTHLSAALSGRYEILRELGRGGMSVVFLARDLRLDREVAIKALRPELTQSVGADRFQREIQLVAHFEHLHLLQVYESGTADGVLFYTMPYARDGSLRDLLCKEQQLSLDDVVRITREVAEGVAHAHERGVVHRDLKPENILFVNGHAVVADFGIAHAYSEAGGETFTAYGVAIGTPLYMSPEQAAGEARIDHRSDVYSLGCVVYEMLTGGPPFEGPTTQAVLAKQMHERVPSLQVVRANIPLGMVQAVEKALAKVPADRFATTQQFVQALDAPGRPTRLAYRPRRWRRPLAVTALAAALVPVGWLVWTLIGGSGPPLSSARILAFPVEVSGVAPIAGAELGIDIVTAMTGLLDSWGDMRWLDARDFLQPEDRADVSRLTLRVKRRVARAQGAAYFTSGRLIYGADSARLYLDLYHVHDREPVDRASAVGLPQDYISLGPEAASALLLALLPKDQAAEVPSVAGFSSPAIQAFVQGELAYRRGRFHDAWRHYSAALDVDSLFALAALQAAKALTWIEGSEGLSRAQRFVQQAVRGAEHLAARDRLMALGLRDYLAGDADSALAHLRAARDMDDQRPDAWVAMGLAYRHLIPMEPYQDSLALVHLRRAYDLSPDFAPAVFYLGSRAARGGDIASARRYLSELRQTEADTSELAKLELEVRCASQSPDAIDWRAETLRDVNVVFQMARRFHIGLSNPACAEAGWRAVVQYDTTARPDHRFTATLGLQSLLAAQQRTADVQLVLDGAESASARWMYIVDALAGLDVSHQAESTAVQLRSQLWPRSPTMLWPLAVWDARTGQPDEARTIRDSLEARAARAGATSTDTLLWRSVAAHVALAEGDTTAAVRAFRSLRPTAPRPSLTWQPWLSLGYDWLVLAQLLEARGEYQEALRILTIAQAPGSVSNLTFRPALIALEERIRSQ